MFLRNHGFNVASNT